MAQLEESGNSCVGRVHRVASSYTEAIYKGSLSPHPQETVFQRFLQAVGPDVRDRLLRFRERVRSKAFDTPTTPNFATMLRDFADQVVKHEPDAEIVWPHGRERCKLVCTWRCCLTCSCISLSLIF